MTAGQESLGVASITLSADPLPLDRALASAERRTQASMDSIERMSGRRLAAVGQNMSRLGSQWTRTVSLPIIGGGAAMVKVASDFESALTQVETQAGASRREIENMRGAILNLAPAVGQTPTQLANALFHIESAGMRGAKALDLLTQSAKLAQIGHSDLEQTTNALVAVMKSAPKDVHNASQAIGILNATVGQGNMRMGDMVGALSTGIIPAAKAAGLGLRDVGAAIDVMTARGVPATDAATRLRMTIALMAAPTSKAAKELAGIGLSSDQLAKDMRKPDGLVIAVEDLKHHLDSAGLSATQQNAVIAKAFGGGRSSSGLLTMLQNVGDLQKAFNGIGQHSGAQEVSKAWATTQHDVGFKWNQMKAEAQKSAIEVGQAIGPELLSVGEGIAKDAGKIASAFASLPKGAQDAIVKGGLLLAGIGPALRLMGVFTTGAGRLWDAAKIAEGLASGNRSLFNAAKTTSSLAGGSTASMEVGTLLVRNMIGGAAGSVSSTSTRLGTAGATAEQGAAAGGGLAATAGGVLSRLVGAAGMAMFAAPLALATYSALRQLFKSDSYGTTIAHQVFAGGFGGSQAPNLSKQVADALDRLHRDTTVTRRISVSRGTPGRAGGTSYSTATENVHLRVDQLTPEAQAKAEADADRAGRLIARQLENGWSQYRFQSEPVMFQQLRSKMKDLPPAAQAAAALSAVKFAEGLERHGRLTKGSAARMLTDIERQFPPFERYLGLAAGDGIRQFDRAFDFSRIEANLKSQLHKISQDFPQVQKAVADTAGTVQDKTAAAIKALQRIEQNGTGPMKRRASADLAALRDTTRKDLTAMANSVVSETNRMSGAIKQGSGSAARSAATNMASFTQHVTDAMSNSSIATGEGMNLIISTLNKALGEMGQKQLSPIQVAQFKMRLGTKGAFTSGHGQAAARGALVQFGRAGDAGADNIPVNMGGESIVVGSGEVGAVLTRHQFGALNQILGGVGGLPGFIQRHNRPNYLASGGMVRGFAGGGAVSHVAGPDISGAGVLAQLVRAASQKGTVAANAYLKGHGPSSSSSSGPSGAGGPVPSGTVRDWLTRALQITNHFSAANLSALYSRTMQESGGNPHAINLTDSNAAAGHPSKGLLQTIDSTFAGYSFPGMGDIWNPIDNAVAAIRYMFARYGHIVGASGSGYARGGILPGRRAATGLVGLGSMPRPGSITPRSRSRFAPIQPLALATPVINSLAGSLSSLLDPNTGQLAKAQDRDQSLQAIFATTPLAAINTAGDAIVTPTDGSPPYINEQLVTGRLGQLNQLYQLELNARTDLQAALGMIGPLLTRLAHAIRERQQRIAVIRKHIRDNLVKIARLAKLVADERKRKLPGNSKARAVARKASDSRIALWNGQIRSLKDENATLGGDRDKIGGGGQIGTLQTQITSLQGTIATAVQDRQAIIGPSGIGGELGAAKVDILSRLNDIAALSPTALNAALSIATASSAGTGGASASTDQSALISLLQQQLQTSQLAYQVSQRQYPVLANATGRLPPFGGSFLTGGMVPGPAGMPRTIIAHGHETIIPVGGGTSETTVRITGKDAGWLRDLIDIQIEKSNRTAGRLLSNPLPSRSGGRMRP